MKLIAKVILPEGLSEASETPRARNFTISFLLLVSSRLATIKSRKPKLYLFPPTTTYNVNRLQTYAQVPITLRTVSLFEAKTEDGLLGRMRYMVERMMAPQRCPRPNSHDLRTC